MKGDQDNRKLLFETNYPSHYDTLIERNSRGDASHSNALKRNQDNHHKKDPPKKDISFLRKNSYLCVQSTWLSWKSSRSTLV